VCITHGDLKHPAGEKGEGFGCLLTETGSYLGNRGSLTTTSFFALNIVKVSGALFAVEVLQMNTALSEIKKWNTKYLN
jgi:hypothetical protein